jgi:four helix bundle protein
LSVNKGGKRVQDFKQLNVWQNAHQLTLELYNATRRFPKDELYGLTSQMRRCSSSIAANIAEGCGRGGNLDFSRFLHIAMGSASELEYHLLLARDLGLLASSTHSQLDGRVVEVKRMLTSLIRRVKAKS